MTADQKSEAAFDIQARSLASLREGACPCLRCIEDRKEMRVRFTSCPTCGNKRCPRASDHRLECSNSNEPGQTGSAYQ